MAALDTDIDIDGVPLRVGLTVGVAIFPQDGADAVTLVANADAALVPREIGSARIDPLLRAVDGSAAA